MEKIINKLKELKEELEKLKTVSYSEGMERRQEIHNFIERIIDRIYPENDASALKKKMRGLYIAYSGKTYEQEQEDYLRHTDLILRVIKTIIEEYELFGFDDFKPIKEKTETETGIKVGPVSYRKKKTSV